MNHIYKFYASQQQRTHSLSFSIAFIYAMICHGFARKCHSRFKILDSLNLSLSTHSDVVVVNIYLRRFIVTIIVIRHW